MTRRELLALPKREWDEILHGVSGVYVIPTRRKHESGWCCMDFVAQFKDGRPMVGFGGGCDDVMFSGNNFRMDCDYPSGIIHIWSLKTFSISCDLSSINFTEDP